MAPDPKALKSSYEGIWKYPTNRDVPFRMAEDWLDAKRKDDDIESLWRVHDKLYNLESFIKSHPGGPQWLEMSRGTDTTEAFEASHTVNVKLVEMSLAKYFVRDASHPRISPYTFKPDGFYMTLKRRVEPILKEIGTGPTTFMLFMQDSLILLFILCGALGAMWNCNCLAILSGMFLGMSTIGAHNFFHLRENWRRYYFDLSLLSSEKSWFQKHFAILYSHLIYATGFWIDIGKRILHIGQGKKQLRWENLLVLVELFGLIVLSDGIWTALKTWLVLHTVSSYVLLSIGATAAHHHPDIFHDGDEPLPDPDFGIGQLDATRDRAETIFQNPFVTLITFGQHPLHHLFPTVCHSKLPYLRETFEKTVREFKLDDYLFKGIPQKELYLGCYKQLARMEIKKRKKLD